MNLPNWLQQQEAAIRAWVSGHEAGIQIGAGQSGGGLSTWVPSHPIESLIVGIALIMLLRLLPGPRRPE
jgi:hypothetical protein